jgi:hypothetical protein
MYSEQCNVTTGVINDGGISYTQMKVDIAFPTQMTEQESGEGDMNAILKRDSKGGPNIMGKRVKNQNHTYTIHRNTINSFIPLGSNIQFSTNTEKEQVIIKKNL